jgi:zinc protease
MTETTNGICREDFAGATIITIEDASLPVVRWVAAAPGGSSLDPAGKSGALSMTMDLMLRGTQHKSREVFSSHLEGLGSSLSALGGNELAMLRGLSLKRNLGETLGLMREVMLEPELSEQEFEILREETIDDIVSIPDDDGSLCGVFWRRALYGEHPLSRMPSGEIGELLNLTLDDVKAMHKKVFEEGRLLWVFSGDITPAEAREAVESIYSTDTPREYLQTPTEPVASRQAPHIVVIDKPDRVQVQLRVGHMAVSGEHEDVDPLWLGSTAFGGTFTSPLTHEVREVRGWSYFAATEFRRQRRTPSPMVMHTAPAQEDLVDCLKLEWELFTGLADGQLAHKDIERARQYILGRYPLSIATASDRMVPALYLELLGKPAHDIYALPRRIEKLEAKVVSEAMNKHLDPAKLLVVMVATAKDVVDGLRAEFADATIEVRDYREGLTRPS